MDQHLISRTIAAKILQNLSFFPVVGIVGPRQVGKTTLVKSLQEAIPKPTLYLDLQLRSDLFKLQDAEYYLSQFEDHCIIIDEIQLKPDLFALLRALIDKRREPARFIILGSASPHLLRKSSESLAGRISYVELMPFSLTEIGETDYKKHWFRGGFPDAFLAPSDNLAQEWIQNFIQTYLQRDVRELGFDISPQLMDRLLRMLTSVQGGLFNAQMLSMSLGISSPTVTRYIDILEGSFLMHRLLPYFNNVGKRLVKSPKIYFRDTGILHYLHSLNSFDNLLGNALVGLSWEGYVIEEIYKKIANQNYQMYFYRTQAGAEADLVLINPSGEISCIEIKFSISPSISKGFHIAAEDTKAKNKFVITPPNAIIRRSDGVIVCGLDDFLREFL